MRTGVLVGFNSELRFRIVTCKSSRTFLTDFLPIPGIKVLALAIVAIAAVGLTLRTII